MYPTNIHVLLSHFSGVKLLWSNNAKVNYYTTFKRAPIFEFTLPTGLFKFTLKVPAFRVLLQLLLNNVVALLTNIVLMLIV